MCCKIFFLFIFFRLYPKVLLIQFHHTEYVRYIITILPLVKRWRITEIYAIKVKTLDLCWKMFCGNLKIPISFFQFLYRKYQHHKKYVMKTQLSMHTDVNKICSFKVSHAVNVYIFSWNKIFYKKFTTLLCLAETFS